MDNTQNNNEQASLPNFDAIRHLDDDGREYWYARELYPLLGYSRWQRFQAVIEKAKTACKSLKINDSDHFTNLGKMVDLGSGSSREIDDVALSRYACYLIVLTPASFSGMLRLGAENTFTSGHRTRQTSGIFIST